MAITITNRSLQGAGVGASTTCNGTHTTDAGTNLCLVVGVGYQGGSTTCTGTYNGVSLGTPTHKRDNIGIQGVFLFVLPAPSAGSSLALNITFGASVDLANWGALSLSGVNQSTPTRTVYSKNESDNATPLVTVIDSAAGDVVCDVVIAYAAAFTVGAGQDSTNTEDDAIVGGSSSMGVSTESSSGASTAMSWSAGAFWAQIATALMPAPSGGTARQRLVNGGLLRGRLVA